MPCQKGKNKSGVHFMAYIRVKHLVSHFDFSKHFNLTQPLVLNKMSTPQETGSLTEMLKCDKRSHMDYLLVY